MKADEKLDQLGVDYELVEQDNPAKSCDDAARERGLETRQIVKSLIVEAGGEKYHVLIPGDRELSEKKLGMEYRMLPPEESREITGFESGTVHPFSTELEHLVDERIFENDRVSHTIGDAKIGLVTDSSKFRDAMEEAEFDFRAGDFVVSTEEDYEEIESYGVDENDGKFVVDRGYRQDFLQLSAEFEPERVLQLLRAFHRKELEVGREIAEEIIERSEDETHLQKLVEEYSEKGELPEENDFDLEEVVRETVESHPDAVEDFRDGKDSAMNFFIGQVMQRTNGKADAGEARKLLDEELEP